MTPRNEIVTELGVERLCRGCGEFWPRDDTFWYFDPRHPHRVMGRCRACWSERVRDEHGRARFADPLPNYERAS